MSNEEKKVRSKSIANFFNGLFKKETKSDTEDNFKKEEVQFTETKRSSSCQLENVPVSKIRFTKSIILKEQYMEV